MQIKDLANETGLSKDTLRYYERLSLLTPKRDEYNNYRTYSRDSVEKLKIIKKAQEMGFSLKEIQNILKEIENESPCPVQKLQARAARKLKEVNKKLYSLTQTKNKLSQSLEVSEFSNSGLKKIILED